jgi:hypothetical protein
MKFFLRKFLSSIISTIWSKLIIINLFLLDKLSKKKYLYSNSGGFGDTYEFFLETYNLINRNKDFIPLSYTQYQKSIVNFLFQKKKNIFFSIPKFIPTIYTTISKVKKSKYFTPYLNVSFVSSGTQDLKKLSNNSTYELLNQKLLKSEISKDLLFLQNENYLCLHIKHYDNKINNLNGSHSRQTTRLEKVFSLINYLLKNKIKVLILGNKYDKFIPIIKQEIEKKIIFKNSTNKIFFLDNLSNKYSFADQVFATKHSKGYVGSAAGMADLFYFLKRKSICFDTFCSKKFENVYNKKYRKYLHKKIEIRKKVSILKDSSLEIKKKYKIHETPAIELLKVVKNFLL